MFSDEGRSLDEDTLEYAWLLEVQLGKLSGKLTAPQVRTLNAIFVSFRTSLWSNAGGCRSQSGRGVKFANCGGGRIRMLRFNCHE